MDAIISWVMSEWRSVIIPIIIFAIALLLTFWMRKLAYSYLRNLIPRNLWKTNEKMIEAFRVPSALWCLFLSIFLSLFISTIPGDWKNIISRAMWTLLLASLSVPLLNIVSNAFMFYGQTYKVAKNTILFSQFIIRLVILLISVMIALEIWGVSNNTLLLFLVVALLALTLAFRDTFPNFFANFQLTANQQIKIGDYIKLENGEEGYVIHMGWSKTYLQTAGENILTVPNSQLLQRIVINYGRPLKKAMQPFQFNTRKILKISTGIKAKNLQELMEYVKVIPEDILFCHTYRCLEENPYINSESVNDFAAWVRDVLGNRCLANSLANIHINGCFDMMSLRETIVTQLQEYLSSRPLIEDVPSGKEFYFIKASSIVFPTYFVAHDLREFSEALRKVALDSIYYHFLGSKMRLQKGINDFSAWLEDSLNESELGRLINRINPYVLSPEGFRSELIRSIEKHIK